MKIIPLAINKKNNGVLKGSSMALGFLDGLHIGHRELLQEVLSSSNPSVLTFSSGMKESLFCSGKELILTEEEKEEKLQSLGIEADYILAFDEKTKNSTKEEFLLFLSSLKPCLLVAGKDFTFGKDREGKAEDLLSLKKEGIEVRILPLLFQDDEKVSSTRIKEEIRKGNIPEANRLLGYPFFVDGLVLHGLENGRKIGFPTANIKIPDGKVKPSIGVYKTRTAVDGVLYPSMTSYSSHPTVEELKKPILETNILGYSKDLYGKKIRVEFLEYLGPIRKYGSLEELKDALSSFREKCR